MQDNPRKQLPIIELPANRRPGLRLDRARNSQARAARRARVAEYLADPFLRRLDDACGKAGLLQSISLDLTHVCQLRCDGCYFFDERLDSSKSPRDEAVFDEFIEREKARGTNYITVLGGEPSLKLDRLKKLYDNFMILPVTNGLRRIPHEGFEKMPIGVSVWGDHALDTTLRGGGKTDVFSRALANYRDDKRVAFYYTVTSGNAHMIGPVVDEIVGNGNLVYFSFYEDKQKLGGALDSSKGYALVRDEIYRMIDKYPDKIISTAYAIGVSTTDRLFDLTWSYDVCPIISGNYEKNFARMRNGQPYSPHFRAYSPDLTTVRRCTVGEDSDCNDCHNAYARHTWILINRDRHLDSKQDFTNWLTAKYMFYVGAGAIDLSEGLVNLPEIHERTRAARIMETGRA
jgi:hypothetical protein